MKGALGGPQLLSQTKFFALEAILHNAKSKPAASCHVAQK